MAPVDLPYLQSYRSNGRLFWYYRRGGRRFRLRGEPGSAEFLTAYAAAQLASDPHAKVPQLLPARDGSLRALVQAFRAAPEFRQLAAGTRAGYVRHLDALLPRFGDLPVAELPRAWVLAIRDELQATPRAANYRVTVLRRLLAWSIDRGQRTDNPAARVKPLRTGSGHRRWTATELVVMTGPAAGDLAWPVRLAIETAQRLGDILALTWSAFDGTALRLRQRKTGAEMIIPIARETGTALQAERERQRAEATSRDLPAPLAICVTDKLRPWQTDWFKHSFAARRLELGLPDDLHFHGLRHTAAAGLAESGASDAEIQAMTGHKSRSQVERYTKQARQERLAKSAVARLRPEQSEDKSV